MCRVQNAFCQNVVDITQLSKLLILKSLKPTTDCWHRVEIRLYACIGDQAYVWDPSCITSFIVNVLMLLQLSDIWWCGREAVYLGLEDTEAVQQISGSWLSLHQCIVASARDVQSCHGRLGWTDKVLGLDCWDCCCIETVLLWLVSCVMMNVCLETELVVKVGIMTWPLPQDYDAEDIEI